MKTLGTLMAVLASLVLAGCAAFVDSETKGMIGRTLYTRHNLHADPYGKVYSENYLIPGSLVPAHAEVTIIKARPSYVVLRDAEGKTFRYEVGDKTLDTTPLNEHLKSVLMTDPAKSKAELDALPELDKKNITPGWVAKGMTRKGVYYSLGPPPKFMPGNEESSDTWTYLKDFSTKVTVKFDASGVVEWIKREPLPRKKDQ